MASDVPGPVGVKRDLDGEEDAASKRPRGTGWDVGAPSDAQSGGSATASTYAPAEGWPPAAEGCGQSGTSAPSPYQVPDSAPPDGQQTWPSAPPPPPPPPPQLAPPPPPPAPPQPQYAQPQYAPSQYAPPQYAPQQYAPPDRKQPPWLTAAMASYQHLDAAAQEKLSQWLVAKSARDFFTADAIREELRAQGVDPDKSKQVDGAPADAASWADAPAPQSSKICFPHLNSGRCSVANCRFPPP